MLRPIGLRTAALAIAVAHGLAAQQATPVRPLAFTRLELPNGIVALLNEDRSSPVVGVEVLYRLGARDERPGQHGFAHLCEHLLDAPTARRSLDFKTFARGLGGLSSGLYAAWAATDEDRTHFFYSVPSDQLATVLWAEADRMSNRFDRVDSAFFRKEREVIRQERLQSRESRAFGDADRLTLDSFFEGQSTHPRDPLGPMDDLDAANVDAVRQFCNPYYVPNNSIIALSGDFNRDSVGVFLRKYFAGLPSAPRVARAAVRSTPLTAERRLVIEDPRVTVPRLRFAWPTVGFSHADRDALNGLAAVLANADPRLALLLPGADQAGRLSKLLVIDRQLATSVTASNLELDQIGVFQIEVAPRPNASLSTIETLVDSVLADVSVHPIASSEIAAFKHFTSVLAVTSLQTRSARADTLAQGEAFARNPVFYARQADHILALEPAQLERVAKTYFTRGRVVMSLVPAGKLDLISHPQLPFTNVTPEYVLKAKR